MDVSCRPKGIFQAPQRSQAEERTPSFPLLESAKFIGNPAATSAGSLEID